MKVTGITPIAAALPLRRPMNLGGRELTVTENVFVRIETDAGLTGWGEASSAPSMTGETVASIMAAIRYLTPYLEGREPSAFAANLAEMDRRMYGNSSAKAALEMALYDIAGKAAGMSVGELLGGARRTRMPVLWMLAEGELHADVADARGKRDQGFTAFKVKAGAKPVDDDVARAIAVREAVPGVQLSADANQGWTTAQAVAFVSGIGDAMDFVEQPVVGHDLDGMAEVARRASVPLGADEGLHSASDISRHHDRHAAQGGSLKMIKFGGLTRTLEAARLCHSLGMNTNIAGKIAESSLATAAVLHLASAVPSLAWGLSVTQQYLSADVVRAPIPVEAGHVRPPEGLGLGVEIDEAALQAFAFDA